MIIAEIAYSHWVLFCVWLSTGRSFKGKL